MRGILAAALAVAAIATAACTAPHGVTDIQLYKLRMCESGGNYSTNTGNGFYGAYQFDRQTWAGLGNAGLPSAASPATQDAAVRTLHAQRGWAPWPVCGRLV